MQLKRHGTIASFAICTLLAKTNSVAWVNSARPLSRVGGERLLYDIIAQAESRNEDSCCATPRAWEPGM
jgi:hypothetical protein